jgi:hypothetical protein
VINCDKTNIRNENSTDKRKQNVINVRNDRENELEFKSGTVIFFSKAGLTRESFIETLYIDYQLSFIILVCRNSFVSCKLNLFLIKLFTFALFNVLNYLIFRAHFFRSISTSYFFVRHCWNLRIFSCVNGF